MRGKHSGRWFVGPVFDLGLFHIPVWLCWLTAFALPDDVIHADLSLWVWVGVVLLVDVGHVWSTIWRTWLDPASRPAQRRLLRVVPVVCLIPALILAVISEDLFWRVLAYVAVFHFIKQQIGVTSLYRARWSQTHAVARPDQKRLAALDKAAIYVGTGFPILWWHLHLPRKISWFIPGDFIGFNPVVQWFAAMPTLTTALTWLFYTVWVGVLTWWLIEHLRFLKRTSLPFPLGKMLWVSGTAVNWWLGIVYFDSDLVFTLTNVIAHGIPYYGLIALVRLRRQHREHPTTTAALPAALTIAALILVLFLALSEEYLWDALLYRDHRAFFSGIMAYTHDVLEQPLARGVAVAFLSMPQVVHYVLDGFIWKFNHHNPQLRADLLPEA